MIELEDVPELRDPIIIAAFEGWNDAGEAATSVITHLADVWDAEPIAALDPEEYYDFQVNRPRVVTEEAQRRIIWPTTRILLARNTSFDRDVVLVIHDWGATLGFDWAHQHEDRVQGIAYMEAAPLPLTWSDFPDDLARDTFNAFRSEASEDMVLRDNMFVEAFLINVEKSNLSDADKAEYRRPFLNAGEDRRPTLTWPRQIPLDGSPPEVAKIVSGFSDWLKLSTVPKLWVRGDPGFIATGRFATFCEGLKNQTEIRVKGGHFLQESSGPEIGKAVADFVRDLRH